MLIDAHCHVDSYRDPAAAAQEIERRAISTVAVTNLPSHYELGRPFVAGCRYVHLALGLHPLFAKHHASELEHFQRLVTSANYIGEIGLDFSREGIGTRSVQEESFEQVLSHLSDRPRFVTLHSRRAEEEVVGALRRHGIGGAVLHWFSGSVRVLQSAVNDGHYFSVNPAMIGTPRGLSMVGKIPRDRVLTESDGPYVRIGKRPANPRDVHLVISAIAELWGTSVSAVEETVSENFARLTISPLRQP